MSVMIFYSKSSRVVIGVGTINEKYSYLVELAHSRSVLVCISLGMQLPLHF